MRLRLKNKGAGSSGRRRSLAPFLLGVALFEASLLAGSRAAEMLHAARPRSTGALTGGESELAQWRRETMRGTSDPATGMPAPQLQLRTPAGAPVSTAAGERRVVIFAPDAAG